jgi:hypothetical protein
MSTNHDDEVLKGCLVHQHCKFLNKLADRLQNPETKAYMPRRARGALRDACSHLADVIGLEDDFREQNEVLHEMGVLNDAPIDDANRIAWSKLELRASVIQARIAARRVRMTRRSARRITGRIAKRA